MRFTKINTYHMASSAQTCVLLNCLPSPRTQVDCSAATVEELYGEMDLDGSGYATVGVVFVWVWSSCISAIHVYTAVCTMSWYMMIMYT